MGHYFIDSVEEGKVSAFLLASMGILCLRYSIMRKKMLMEVGICFSFFLFSFLTDYLFVVVILLFVILSSKF